MCFHVLVTSLLVYKNFEVAWTGENWEWTNIAYSKDNEIGSREFSYICAARKSMVVFKNVLSVKMTR